jgi:hypothetical protein
MPSNNIKGGRYGVVTYTSRAMTTLVEQNQEDLSLMESDGQEQALNAGTRTYRNPPSVEGLREDGGKEHSD